MRQLLFLLSLFGCLAAASQEATKKATQNTRPVIREVKLSGSGYGLGFQHGEILKNEIAEILQRWKENTSRQLQKHADTVLKDFFAYAKFDEAIKKWTPQLFEEIRGIAAGSGQSFNDIMVLNLLDEFWVYQDNLFNHHCSSLGVPATAGRPASIAQNIDIETYTDGYQVLLRIKGSENIPEQLVITHPGVIGLAGMNAKGVGACMNSLMQLKASSSGLPVAFIVRRILMSTNKKDVLNFIQSVPHASGQNYLIGIGNDIFDFEASANKVVPLEPTTSNGTIAHTNHPLINDDVKEWYQRFSPSAKNALYASRSNSHIRLKAVERYVSSNSIDDALFKTVLRSKDDTRNPVCRSAQGGGFTFASVIMTLEETPFMQVTSGPPDESDYTRFDFTKE